MPVSSKIRKAVFARDHYFCAMTAYSSCVGDLTLQHRVGRGMGGSKRLDGFSNLLSLCAWHNQLIEADAQAKQWALRHGVSVLRRHAALFDVAHIPVFVDGEWWFLDGAGFRVGVPDVTAEAIIEDLLYEGE